MGILYSLHVALYPRQKGGGAAAFGRAFDLHCPSPELTLGGGALADILNRVVAGVGGDAGHRRAHRGLRAFERLDEARSVEQEQAGHVPGLIVPRR